MHLLYFRRMKAAAVCLLLAFAGIMSAPAKTIDIPTTDAHLDLPDDWTVMNRDDIALYAFSSGTGASATISLFVNDKGQTVDQPQFVANMERVLLERAKKEGATMKMLSEGSTDLNGVPADFLQAELAFPEGGVAYARSYALAENKSILVMTLLSRDPTADASLQKIARTLRFDRPPLLPDANLWRNYHLGWGLLAFAVIVVAGLLILWWACRRTS